MISARKTIPRGGEGNNTDNCFVLLLFFCALGVLFGFRFFYACALSHSPTLRTEWHLHCHTSYYREEIPSAGQRVLEVSFCPLPVQLLSLLSYPEPFAEQVARPLSGAGATEGSRAISSNYGAFGAPQAPRSSSITVKASGGKQRRAHKTFRHKQPTVEKTQNTGEPSPARHGNHRQIANELASALPLLRFYFSVRPGCGGAARRSGVGNRGNRVIPPFSPGQTAAGDRRRCRRRIPISREGRGSGESRAVPASWQSQPQGEGRESHQYQKRDRGAGGEPWV